MKYQFSKFPIHYEAYKKTFTRVFVDAYCMYKKQIFGVVFSGFVGVCGQLAGISSILILARTFENEGTLNLFGITIKLDLSIPLFINLGLIIFTLLFISALFQYISDRKALTVACEYEKSLVKRFVSLASKQPIMFDCSPYKYDKDVIIGLISKDVRNINRILNILLTNQIDVIFFLVFLVFSLWLDALTTTAIFLFIIIYLLILYQINLHGAINSIRIDKLARPSGKEKASLINSIEKTTTSIDENDKWLNNIFSKGKTGEYIGAFEQRLSVTPSSRFLNTAFSGFIICGIITIQSSYIFFYNGSWGIMIAYLLGIRQVLVKLSKLGMAITSINRLYPHARRYFEYQDYFNDNLEKTLEIIPAREIRLNVESLHNKENKILIKRGVPVGIISNKVLDRLIIIELLKLADQKYNTKIAIISSNVNLNNVNKLYRSKFRNYINNIGLSKQYNNFYLGNEGEIQYSKDEKVLGELCFLQKLVETIDNKDDILFINGLDFLQFSLEHREKIISHLQDKFIIIVSRQGDLKNLLNSDAEVLINNNITIAGWATMEWIVNNPNVLLKFKKISETQSYDDADIMNYFDE